MINKILGSILFFLAIHSHGMQNTYHITNGANKGVAFCLDNDKRIFVAPGIFCEHSGKNKWFEIHHPDESNTFHSSTDIEILNFEPFGQFFFFKLKEEAPKENSVLNFNFDLPKIGAEISTFFVDNSHSIKISATILDDYNLDSSKNIRYKLFLNTSTKVTPSDGSPVLNNKGNVIGLHFTSELILIKFIFSLYEKFILKEKVIEYKDIPGQLCRKFLKDIVYYDNFPLGQKLQDKILQCDALVKEDSLIQKYKGIEGLNTFLMFEAWNDNKSCLQDDDIILAINDNIRYAENFLENLQEEKEHTVTFLRYGDLFREKIQLITIKEERGVFILDSQNKIKFSTSSFEKRLKFESIDTLPKMYIFFNEEFYKITHFCKTETRTYVDFLKAFYQKFFKTKSSNRFFLQYIDRSYNEGSSRQILPQELGDNEELFLSIVYFDSKIKNWAIQSLNKYIESYILSNIN